ncbi:MAG TPA: T9SS type A sorting domain-containing protein [Puia sp.]
MKSLLKTHFLPFNLHCPKSSTQTMADRTLIGLIVLLALMIPAKILGQDTSMTFTVNVIGDESDPNAGMPGHKCDPTVPGDQCTLRAAIENHNANRQLPQNHIRFAIPNAPGSGSIVIKVGSTGLGPLPPVLGSVTIFALNNDGSGGSSRRIEIDGSMAGSNAIGLQLLGGQCQISFFIINSFSSHGIYIAGTPPPGDGGHLLESNYIGTDSTGTVDKGNGGDGVFIENTPGNIIGGTGLRRNIISANKGYGIHILGRDSSQTGQRNGGQNNLAQANIIGLDFFGQKLLPNALDAVILDNAPNNTIGGTSTNQGNTMGGTKNGVTIVGSFSEGIKIQGNFIGIDGSGARFSAGIFSRGGKQLSVEGNILTNIDSVGVDLFLDASGNYNFIKNRFDGDMKIGSKFRFGPGRTVDITYQENFHLNNALAFDAQESINGTINWIVLGDTIRAGQTGANFIFMAAGTKNFTSNRWEGTAGVGFNYAANIGPGVIAKLTQSTEVFAKNGQQGVYGKLNVGGELAISMADISGNQNGKDACRLEFVVGGGASVTLNSTRNKYTANAFAGLRLLSDGNNLDLIHVFVEKDFVDGNTMAGIDILKMRLKNSIANSTITNNGGPGIVIDGNSDVRIDSNTISGNGIAVLFNGVATGSVSDNTITGNGKGIALAGTGTGIGISGNLIFNNAGLGIDLGNDGVTPNHIGFLAGPNNFQNHPVLTSAKVSGGNTIIKGTMNSLANSIYRIEFFSNVACNPLGVGDGQTFLGFKQVTTDATGNAGFTDTLMGVSMPAEAVITSTATDSANNSSEFSACVLATVLPLHLLDFTATTNGSHITLRWITAGEQNTKYFDIERSGDGSIFDVQGQVPASGNSSEQKNYVFIDQQPLQGINIYRLRMVDLDGSFTYSKIVVIKMDALQNTLSVFPNPAAKELTIQLFARGPFQLKITDINGRILKEEVIQLSGNTSKTMDISNLPEGVYIFILQNSNEIQYRKFIKQ